MCGDKHETAVEGKETEASVAPVPESTSWRSDFFRHLDGCAAGGLPFRAEHVLAIVGMPTNVDPATVKSMMLSAEKRGIIKRTESNEWIGM